MACATPPFGIDQVSDAAKHAEYAPRGPIVVRAVELEKQLDERPESLPFSRMVFCNIGNPQALDQKPVRFFREVLSCLFNPALIDDATTGLAADARRRAGEFLSHTKGSIGAYTHSQGFAHVRKNVAAFIEKRDGCPASPNDIYITDGASSGIKLWLQLLLNQPTDGIMVPVPQYPLYSASICLFGGQFVGYQLHETTGWSIGVSELQASLDAAQAAGTTCRAIVVINPGNPTGACLTEAQIGEILDFAHANNLVVLADEVYQTNIYMEKPFVSFAQVLKKLGRTQPLVSFHSVSKGFVGECGARGGFFEAIGIDDDVMSVVYKLSSISLCSNVTGQALVDLMVCPPVEGDESFAQYQDETEGRIVELKRRAGILSQGLDLIPGIVSQPVEGAMYAFPSVTLPQIALDEAEALGKPADFLYCMRLLEATGVVVVPGSGFAQEPGTYHFRTTILPPAEDMEYMVSELDKFHRAYEATVEAAVAKAAASSSPRVQTSVHAN